MSDIAKHVTDDDRPGLYATRYRNPHDGHLYVGPEIRAGGRAEAERIADPWRYASGCPRWHRWPATEHGNGPPPPPDPDAPTEERDGFALRFRDFVR